ncbi:MAG TPA: hypothetical protein VN612_04485 [Acidobacteriaceae bacterium]|nr:hypothetical protein [Acidobacteriaceae bacterium]
MNLSLHLRIVGVLLTLLGVSHVFFNRYFGWSKELQAVSLLTRRVFFVHSFFVAMGVALSGLLTLFYADELLRPAPLNRALLAAIAAFWFCRLLAQFFGYDPAIWKGDRFRTFMHAAFAVLWCYVTATYAAAALALWKLPPAS